MSLDLRMISEDKYSDHIDNKTSHCAKMLNDYYQKYNEQKGTQFVFSDLETYKAGEWNVYSEIKHKLVEDNNIPAHEIRFIQECKNERAKKAMVDAMNRGDIRIIFGSTSMLGTGVNAQQRAVAIHHLDTPWRPSDLEQRNGRAVRIPKVIATHEKELAKATKDIDVYKAISTGVWNKEDELCNIKAQAAELDRKIALTLNPPSEENVAKEGQQTRNTQEQSGQHQSIGNGNTAGSSLDASKTLKSASNYAQTSTPQKEEKQDIMSKVVFSRPKMR